MWGRDYACACGARRQLRSDTDRTCLDCGALMRRWTRGSANQRRAKLLAQAEPRKAPTRAEQREAARRALAKRWPHVERTRKAWVTRRASSAGAGA